MAAVPSLTFHEWDQDAIADLAAACHVNPWGGLQSPAELLNGSFLAEYKNQHQRALIALRRNVFQAGVQVHIQALVSTGDPLQSGPLMASIEATAIQLQANVLTMVSQHPAMAKAAPRWGGHISGAVILKHLRAH